MIEALFPSLYPGTPVVGLAQHLREQNARATLTEEMFDLLRDGAATTDWYQNALAGHARNVGVLEAKGLMRIKAWRGQLTDFEVTEAGRAALLDYLGVHEITR